MDVKRMRHSQDNKASDYNFQAVSLFSGAGGLDLGLRFAGFSIKACLETEPWACKTLALNNPDSVVVGPPIYSGDISNIAPKEFMAITGLLPEQVTLVAGGPPCQPFSIAANQRFSKGDERFKRVGFKDKRRGDLLGYYVDYVICLRPKVFLLENVPGIKELEGGGHLHRELSRLKAVGYAISDPTVINAKDFGVPQVRERLFVIGVRNSNISPKVPLNGEEVSPLFSHRYTVAHALLGLPDDAANHIPRNHKRSSIQRYRTLSFGKREPLGRVDRLDPYKPAKTVISGGTSGGGRSHLHPYLARTLTVRESARLQTFPDDYVFCGTMGRQFTQVGNAVPPMLAAALGYYISREFLGVKPQILRLPISFLQHTKSVDELCQLLHTECLNKYPELVYFDSLETNPSKSDMGQLTLNLLALN